MEYIWVGIGGFVGANARYMLGRAITERIDAAFPFGTFTVNLLGALAIGFLMTMLTDRWIADPFWRQLTVVGFLGGFTTFSSYTWEAIALAEQGNWTTAALYVLGSNVLGLVACAAGIALARAM